MSLSSLLDPEPKYEAPEPQHETTMKIFASHSSVIDNVNDPDAQPQNAAHLQAIAAKLHGFGAKIVEITRFNVVAEIAEHRLLELFDVVIDDTEGFIGKVDAKLHALKDYIDHLEVCAPNPPTGS
jgi:hypothetical protein